MELELEIVCPAWYPGADSLVDAIAVLADQGVTAVEVSTSYSRFGIQYPDYFDHRNAYELETLVTALRASGIRVNSIHAPFGPSVDISSPLDEVHERGVDSLIESIEFASVTGARLVVVHASDVLAGGVWKRMDRARGVLREMASVAEESGVIIALENLPPGYLGHTPEEILTLVEGTRSAAVRVCFDTGHANMSGCFAEFAEALLPYSAQAHLHDNDGSRDLHGFPGTGNIDWHAFAAICCRDDAEISMTLECPPPEGVTWGEAFRRFRELLDA